MTAWQKVVKYIALALAALLSVGIISTAVGLVGVLVGGGNVLDTMQKHEITNTQQIVSLDIDISAAELTVTTGDNFSMESNLKKLTIKTEGDTLLIKEKSNYFFGFGSKRTPKINLVLPDKIFEKIEIETGAGRVSIQTLSAKHLSFEFGAGEVEIDNLSAIENAEMESGAGKVTIANGTLNNLEFEMGVGECNVTAKLTGNNRLKGGVGSFNAYLVGTSEDYTLKVSTGIGSTNIDGKKVTNGTYGNGKSVVQIESGVGEVNVRYKE